MVNEVAGERVADAGAVPLRRVQPAQRPAAAAAQADHRRLRRPRLRDRGLMATTTGIRVRAGAGVARDRPAAAELPDLRRRRVPRRHRRAGQDDQPGRRAAARRGRRGRPGRRRRRGRAPRGARTRAAGRSCPGAERGKYLFRIARAIQERGRELAVLESLDNGKPISESRDVDVPLAAAHFFYYAGWADKLEHAGFGPAPRPLGVAGQIIPWNFPLLMAAWKIAPALACGNTVVLKPAETTPLTALVLAEIIAEADLPPGVVNIARRRPVDRAGDRRARRRRQDRVHRLDRGRQDHPADAGRHRDSELSLELGRQGGEHRLRRRPARPGRRGHRQRHLLQPGPRLLRRVAAARPGVDRRRGDRGAASAGWRRCGSGDPLDKNTDIGAINSAAQLARIRELADVRRRRGRDALVAAVRAARARLLVRADRVHRTSRRRTASPARRSSARCCRC